MSNRPSHLRKSNINRSARTYSVDSKMELSRLQAMNNSSIGMAVETMLAIANHVKVNASSLDREYIDPTLKMATEHLTDINGEYEMIDNHLKSFRVTSKDPVEKAMTIFDKVTACGERIHTGILLPIIDVVEAINDQLPEDRHLDLSGIQKQLDDFQEIVPGEATNANTK